MIGSSAPISAIGWMQPGDRASQYNEISFIFDRMLGRVRTAMLVQVQGVTNDGGLSPVGFVDAVPLVNLMDGAGVCSPHGTVYNLPYFRLQGGTSAVILDPTVGDIGVAIICDRDG